jgi:hypothetical protein
MRATWARETQAQAMGDERDAVQTTMAKRCWSNWKMTLAAQHGLQPTPLPLGLRAVSCFSGGCPSHLCVYFTRRG